LLPWLASRFGSAYSRHKAVGSLVDPLVSVQHFNALVYASRESANCFQMRTNLASEGSLVDLRFTERHAQRQFWTLCGVAEIIFIIVKTFFISLLKNITIRLQKNTKILKIAALAQMVY
jgi:hypothetical protein